MRNAIETAPKNQEPIIVEDEVTGASDKVSWSSAGSHWVKDSGEPTEIKPTHWRPCPSTWTQGRAPISNLDADRATLDFLSAQVSRAPTSPTQRPRRPQRRLIALAIVIGIGGIVVGAHSYIWPARFVQLATARWSEWRATYQLAVSYLSEPKDRNSSPAETTPPTTTKGVALERLRVEDDETPRATAIDLERKQQEVSILREQLEAARREVGVMAAQASVAKQDQRSNALEAALAQLLQERQNLDAVTNESNTARRDLQTKSEELVESKRNVELTAADLREEQKKTAKQAAELSNARSDLERISAQASRANEETQSIKRINQSISDDLQQERQRTAAMSNDAVGLRQKFEKAVKAQEEAAEAQNAATKVAVELRAERQKSALLEAQLDAARREAAVKSSTKATVSPPGGTYSQREAAPIVEDQSENALPTSSSHSKAGTNEDVQVSSKASSPQQRVAAETSATSEATRLIARANGLILQGNITQARIVLDRAAQMGSAQANFAIAETYDPHILSNWKTVGTRPDIAAARDFYSRAATGGVAEAQSRLNALQ